VIGSRIKTAELVIEARESHLAQVRDFVARICMQAGFDPADTANFKLAVDEACTNIIQHSYHNQGGEIAIQVKYFSGQVEIVLKDTGESFDFGSVAVPDLDHYVAIGKRGGLGIYLINRIMDEVIYTTTDGSNELRMCMDRRPPIDRWIPGIQFSALHRSLRMRFTLRASFGLALLVILALSVVHYRQRQTIFDQELSRIEATARDLAVQSRSVLASSDPYSVERTLLQQSVTELARHDSTIAFARVVHGTDGSIWADSVLDDLFNAWHPEPGRLIDHGENSGAWTRIQFDSGRVLQLNYPVSIQGPSGKRVELGRVVLGLKTSDLERRYRAALLHAMGIGLVILLVGILLILVMVNLFVRPIQQLTEGVLAIGDGVLEQNIEVHGPEEISTIAAAFNEIASKFRHAQSHLVEQERLQKEMQLAREIQHTLLPTAMPELSGYEIAAMYRAAAEVGGDYYDFFAVDEDTVGIVVADVSGKGIPGSLVMTMIRTAMRMEARGNHSASDVMSRVNTFITEDMRRGMFITLFYIILDSRNRVISYSSAGHNPMLLYRIETDEVFFLNPAGFPVGISLPDPELFSKTIEVEKVQLQQDDLLLIYTDGVTEAMNAAREQYGEQRLIECVRKNAGRTAEEFIAAFNDDIAAFTGGNAQNDDITVVAVKEKLRPASLEIERRQRLLDMVEVEGMSIEEACGTYGTSVSTYYRWRRMRELGGEEALAGRASQAGLRRLTVEGREAMVELVRTDPSLGAKRLADRLSERGHEANAKMVYDELVRLDLSNEPKRRLYLRRRGLDPQEGAPEENRADHGLGLDRSLHTDEEQPPASQEAGTESVDAGLEKTRN